MGLLSVFPIRMPAPQGKEYFCAHCCKEALDKCFLRESEPSGCGMGTASGSSAQPPPFWPWVQVYSRFRAALPHLFNTFPHSALGREGFPASCSGQHDVVYSQHVEDAHDQCSQSQYPSNFKTTSH